MSDSPTLREPAMPAAKTVVYELVNPSDKYTLESADPAAAVAACLYLGNGAYGLEDEFGETVCPLFLFGKAEEELQVWSEERFGLTVADLLELADDLDCPGCGRNEEIAGYDFLGADVGTAFCRECGRLVTLPDREAPPRRGRTWGRRIIYDRLRGVPGAQCRLPRVQRDDGGPVADELLGGGKHLD